MPRKLDIAIASYGKPQQLQRTVAALQQHSVTDWRCFIIDNPHPTRDCREVICGLADRDMRIIPRFLDFNAKYAGAVNIGTDRCESEYFAYLDDDATVETPAWDETL